MRFLGYFILVFVTLAVMRQLPILGGIFRIPLLGFFLSAIVVSLVIARAGESLASRNRLKRDVRELGEVDTPQRRGKLGRLLLQNKRPAQALEPLRQALAEEPEQVDWHYRLGMALLRTGDAPGALESLQRARDLNEGYAYGGVLLQLSQAALAAGDVPLALSSLERFESLQGPTPEYAYRRGLALKASGLKQEARACFDSISELLAQAPKYQKAQARIWAVRAFWAKHF